MRQSTAPILVVSALREEIRSLSASLVEGRRVSPGLRAGRLAGRPVVLGATGDGAPAASESLRAWIQRVRPAAILGLGFAGGLDPALERGSVVVVDAATESGAVHAAERAWAERVAQALSAPRGAALSVRHLAATPHEKAALWARHGPQARVADLETWAWAAQAQAADCPWLVLRVVFDRAGDEIPAFLVRATDEDGRLRRARLLAAALLRPSRLRALARMGGQARALAKALGGSAEIALRLAP